MNSKNNRPISPHLTIYRPQITSVLSILHRITGVALFGSMLTIAWWLIFLVFSGFCDCYLELLHFWIVKLAFYTLSFAFFYHVFNGIRHLYWDFGYGFEIKSVTFSGIMVLLATLIATIMFWLLM